MTYEFKSTGKIIYDPPRPGLKTKNTWWCVINVDQNITDYYRWWVNKEIMNPLGLPKMGLNKPSWGAHISIIRGEKPKQGYEHLWKKYDGQTVEFTYSINPRQSGDTTGFDRPDNYWFLEVDCPLGIEIRKEFNVPYDWKLHMTIGRTWDR